MARKEFTLSELKVLFLAVGENYMTGLQAIKLIELLPEEEENQSEAEKIFAELWALYPKKVGKSAVKPAAKKEILKAGKETVIKAIENYKIVKEDWREYLDGSTFFNGRWKDYKSVETKTVEKAKNNSNFKERQYDDDFFKKIQNK